MKIEKDTLKKALEIDDTLGEAHVSLGFISTFYDWDWVAAENEFKKALELNPEDEEKLHQKLQRVKSVIEKETSKR